MDLNKSVKTMYKALMDGISYMLPFIVGGGLLMSIAYMIDSIFVDTAVISEELRANFGSIMPAAAFLKQIGSMVFGFMLPILAAYIASSVAGKEALVVGFAGGYLASQGKSGFIGAIIVGYISGILILNLKRIFIKVPKSAKQIITMLVYPLLGVLMISLITVYIIEGPIGFLNTSINTALENMGGTSRILLGAIIGGMMAVDLGGPINKTAYLFATGLMSQGNYYVIAASMLGAMTPPCVIFLSTVLFKTKFTKKERESGLPNLVMGLSFITEGVIPYAATDPLRVLGSCIISSAIAGGMSMGFNCASMSPGGGIFVVPMMENPILYLLSFVTATFVGAVILGISKKSVTEE